MRLSDLELVGFEDEQIPTGYVKAHLALDGTLAAITYDVAKAGQPPQYQPMPCYLRTAATTSSGALKAEYFDGDSGLFYIAIKPSSPSPSSSSAPACVAFDENGCELLVNPNGKCGNNCILIDDARLQRAAEALGGAVPCLTGSSSGGPSSALPAAQPPSAANDENALRSLLEQARLAQYYEAFVEKGWDDAEFISVGADLDQLGADVGMKPGHLARFKTTVRPDS